MTLENVITRVRREIRQITFSSESTQTDADAFELTTSNFSDEDLAERINDAVNTLASVVKAQHVPQLVTKYTSIAGAEGSFRLLPRRVFRIYDSTGDGAPDTKVRCMRRSVDSHRRLEKSGRSATEQRPLFTYDDGVLMIYPDPSPTDVSLEIYGLSAPSPLAFPTDSTVHLEIDERLELALIYVVARSCYASMERTNLVKLVSSVIEDEIRPFSYNMQTHVGIVEHEVDTE